MQTYQGILDFLITNQLIFFFLEQFTSRLSIKEISGSLVLLTKEHLAYPMKNDDNNSKSVSKGNKSKAITTCYGNTSLIWPFIFDKWMSHSRNLKKGKAQYSGTAS